MAGESIQSGPMQPGDEARRGQASGVRRLRSGAVAAAGLVANARGLQAERESGRRRLGVVLGTGLGSLTDRLNDAWSMPARETGWLMSSTATGHAGRLVCGSLSGAARDCDVVVLQGRVHGYEGHAPESLSRGVELLAALGATTVLLTNAAGGLRPDMQVGELMVLSDHIDLVRRPWTQGLVVDPTESVAADGVARAVSMTPCYAPELVASALEAARSAGALARAGVYAHLMGPSYETRAEYRMLRRFGADVVGMSTVPEVIAARRLGLRVAAVSVVTNVARPDAPACTDAEDVCRAAAAAVEGVWAILVRIAALTAGNRASEHAWEGTPR